MSDQPSTEPDVRQVLSITDDASGLKAWLALDELADGLAAGGLHRARFADEDEARASAKRLARAWTLTARGAELDAGGAQVVVHDDPDMDVDRAHRALGRALDSLDPTVLCLTDDEAAAHMDETTDRVNPEGTVPARAQAVGVLSGVQAVLWALEGDPRAEGRDILVRGYGNLARYVTRGLSEEGAKLTVAAEGDDRERAEEAGHQTADPDAWLDHEADVLVLTEGHRLVTADHADEIQARGICPALMEPLASQKAADVLADRGIQYAPSVLVNPGALVEAVLTWREGHAPRVQDEIDRRLSQVYDRTRRVLAQAADREIAPDRIVAERWG